jgi:plasmid stabilization system protein ParE
MDKYEITPEAVGDLFDIWNFIAQDNPEAADRVEAAIFRSCDLLADRPLAGRKRKDLTPLPIRLWVVQPYSNYLIVYDPGKKPLQVIRILHAARDLPSVLKQP